MLPVDIAKFLRIVFLSNTSSGCFWQTYHGTVKSTGVPVLWFCASKCFKFLSKTFMKCCTNNSSLSRDKNNFFLAWKTYTKCCTSNCVMSHVKRLSSSTLHGLPGAFNFRVWFGKQNMAVKILILILFHFGLLCWLIYHTFCILSLLQLQDAS